VRLFIERRVSGWSSPAPAGRRPSFSVEVAGALEVAWVAEDRGEAVHRLNFLGTSSSVGRIGQASRRRCGLVTLFAADPMLPFRRELLGLLDFYYDSGPACINRRWYIPCTSSDLLEE
jgi:hypothetical protein